MSVAWSDPHQILSYDHMHNDSHGLGGKHILPSVLLYLKATGRDALADLDKRFLFPPYVLWPMILSQNFQVQGYAFLEWPDPF